MNNNNRISAEFDNQILRFLVGYCEEGPYFDSGKSLYDFYFRGLHHLKLLGDNAIRSQEMGESSFYRRLELAGFRRETVKVATDKHLATWFHGLRLKPGAIEHLGEIIRLEEARRQERIKQLNPSPPPVSTQNKPVTLVQIAGASYDRRLIASIREIKPFKRHQDGAEMSYIVTFHNGEIGHRFIGSEEAKALLGES